MGIDIIPMTAALGADIHGADIRRDEDFAVIRQAFIDYGVIAVHDQDLSPDDQLKFARRWGPINVNRFFRPLEDHPQIATVLKEPDQTTVIGEDWHTDHSYDERPAMGSILYAIETPPVGGDTMFASVAAGLAGLSAGLRATLGQLSAWHSSRHVFGVDQIGAETHRTGRIGNTARATQDAMHPVVVTHPLSGRPCLYVNTQFTTRFDGWTPDESGPLLRYLQDHCTRPEYTCRMRWKPGTLGMWDNRATWHKAVNDYPGQRRLMHRVTVEGVALERGDA